MIEFNSVEEYIDYLIELKIQENFDKEFALETEIDFLEAGLDTDSDCNSSDYSFDYCQFRSQVENDDDSAELGYN